MKTKLITIETTTCYGCPLLSIREPKRCNKTNRHFKTKKEIFTSIPDDCPFPDKGE